MLFFGKFDRIPVAKTDNNSVFVMFKWTGPLTPVHLGPPNWKFWANETGKSGQGLGGLDFPVSWAQTFQFRWPRLSSLVVRNGPV